MGRGNAYIFLFTSLFGLHAPMYSITAGDLMVNVPADIPVRDCSKDSGCPERLLSMNNQQFCPALLAEAHDHTKDRCERLLSRR